MRCAVVLGTRPEIIKMAPVIWALDRHALPYVLIHTGQHYSYEMDRTFFEALDLAAPAVNLAAGAAGASHGVQTGLMLQRLEPVLQEHGVDRVIVHGDTNTTLAGALTAAKLHLPLGHVEAGLRSHDRSMPEEVNRVVCDHIATGLFAPTTLAVDNLAREGLTAGVVLTGNTIVDTLQALSGSFETGLMLSSLKLTRRQFIVLTLHRQENTDDPDRLAMIIEGLRLTAVRSRLPLVFSLHYRTRERLESLGLRARLEEIPGLMVLHPPVGILEMLELQNHAALVMTDSGGLQEEACILGTPCVTIRENTERPETLRIGANILAGFDPEAIAGAAERQLRSTREWPNPFGDGQAALRCIAAVTGRDDLDPGPLPQPAISGGVC